MNLGLKFAGFRRIKFAKDPNELARAARCRDGPASDADVLATL
jgi:hypothetical protein